MNSNIITLTLEAFNMTGEFLAEMEQAGVIVKPIDAPWEVEFTATRNVLETMLRDHWDMDDEEIKDTLNQ